MCSNLYHFLTGYACLKRILFDVILLGSSLFFYLTLKLKADVKKLFLIKHISDYYEQNSITVNDITATLSLT